MPERSAISETDMAELLSNSKRKYIENWMQNVCHYMENGTICKVTISEMTPEPTGYMSGRIRPSNEHVKAMAARSPPPSSENIAPCQLPAVKFGYSHGVEEVKRRHKNRHSKYHDIARTVLPPSPNGLLVQNGGTEVNIIVDRKSNTLRTIENNYNSENERLIENDSKDDSTKEQLGRSRSSKLAKEIFDKYNMKSQPDIMPIKPIPNGIDQYSMPWRNKTFLTLPVRFNDNVRRKQMKYLAREKTSMSSRKDDLSSSLLTSESRPNFHDWEGDIGL